MHCSYVSLGLQSVKLKGHRGDHWSNSRDGSYLRQYTPISSPCQQLWLPHPRWEQSPMKFSLPEQETSSSQICPLPSW